MQAAAHLARTMATAGASAMQAAPSVLVVGGAGALGQAVCAHFRAHGWACTSADVAESPSAEASVTLPTQPWASQVSHLKASLAGRPPLDAIICTAGGWAGGGAGDAGMVAATEQMTAVCLNPALTSAHLAASGALSPRGLLVLTGSAAALKPTPGMLAYGLAKAATHALARTLAAPGSGLPEGARVACVLPHVIDTPSNRQWMAGPGVDTGAWTPPTHIAQQLHAWAEAQRGGSGASSAVPLPASGSLVEVVTAGGVSSWCEHPPTGAMV